jgi:D-alanyl-D-alanine carboxypeptidase/D-alanyl-D-alanine-endopeptidase (penicillin-binding protein 4)
MSLVCRVPSLRTGWLLALLMAAPSPAPVRAPAELALAPVAGAVATRAGVAHALAGPLSATALGARVDALVLDAATGAALYDHGASVGVVPASTTKVFTAAAALHVLGPTARFTTRVVASGALAAGVLRGDLVVVGGGDPTLTSRTAPASYPRPARLADLARRVRAAGVRRVTGALVVDTSLFSTPGLGPGWKATYVTEGSVAPIGAFLLDGGRVRPDRDDRYGAPDVGGARRLGDALRAAGVRIGGAVRRGRAPVSAKPLAAVESPPVAALVERMLGSSDNELAESLARQVALATHAPTDFAGSSGAVRAAVRDLGVAPPALVDSCGLSPRDRVTPAQLVGVLSLAARDPALAPLLTGLPVAGFTGTLSGRYDKGPARAGAGYVRAKTGSLDNVSTLAGVVETRSGRLLVFAFAADKLPTRFVGAAARALDVAAAALVACGCG